MERKKEHEKSKKDLTENIRKNPWMLATILTSILCLTLLIVSFSGNLTGKVISKNEAGEYLLSYLSSGGVSGLELESVEIEGNFYVVSLLYNGNSYPFYITKEGYYMGNYLKSIVPVKTTTQPTTSTTSISKSDKPLAELYIGLTAHPG
jgi:hypothetical protein